MLITLVAVSLVSTPAAAIDGPRMALVERMAADLRAGRPLVVEAHVALCDNAFVRCGGRGRGDGNDLARNLYWATSGGFDGWFTRRASGWTRVAHVSPDDPDVLDQVVWHRLGEPAQTWKKRGIARPFSVYVIAHAWRGAAIDRARARAVEDLWEKRPRVTRLPDGTELAGGGSAHVVAYLGHNRWMDDRGGYAFPLTDKDAAPKGAVFMACHTAPYLGGLLEGSSRVPLLMTRDFVFAGAHAFDGTLKALLAGSTMAAIRLAGAQAYASGEGKPLARVGGVFTNPSDARWRPGCLATGRPCPTR